MPDLLEAFRQAADAHTLPPCDDRMELRRRERIKGELVSLLMPFVCNVTHDVFDDFGLTKSDDWLAEAIAEGSLAVVRKLSSLLETQIESVGHIRNVLRKPIRKAVSRRLWRLHTVPTPSIETRRKRVNRGEPEFKPWENGKRVAMQGNPQGRVSPTGKFSGPEPVTREEFHARDPNRSTRYFDFLRMFREQCEERTDGQLYLAVVFIGRTRQDQTEHGRPILSAVADRAGMPRRTLKRQLAELGEEIAATAHPELAELGEEFLGFLWERAAKSGTARHRKYRAASRGRSADAA